MLDGSFLGIIDIDEFKVDDNGGMFNIDCVGKNEIDF